MRLLIVTQTVDSRDSLLGFFHSWLAEFAKRAERVEVICLYEGAHKLPANVRVHSLGKEKRARSTIAYAVSFLALAWRLRGDYDAVLVHMNPEYLVLAGPLWRILGKKTALWYTHKSVTWKLRLGSIFADVVFTASAGSMRVGTRKKRVVGHGISLDSIAPVPPPAQDIPLALLTAGRLSPVKRVELLIDAVALLKERGTDAVLTVAGGAAGERGAAYARQLEDRARERGIAERVRFIGAVPHARIKELLADAHLFLHASATGSLDKASLEPLAAGVPVITVDAELAAAGIPSIIRADASAESFADAIEAARRAQLWASESGRVEAREYVARNHELSRLIGRICVEMGSVVSS